MKITERDDNNRQTAIIPKARKLDHLSQYYEYFIESGASLGVVHVQRVVELDRMEWLKFTQSLLDDRDFLEGMGGTNSDYVSRHDNLDDLLQDKPEFERWKAQAYDKVVEVSHDSGFETFTIFIDPQGYDYARYVLWPIDRGIGQKMYEIHQALHGRKAA